MSPVDRWTLVLATIGAGHTLFEFGVARFKRPELLPAVIEFHQTFLPTYLVLAYFAPRLLL